MIVDIAISAGDVTFSVIGNDEMRHFVIVGLPIEELKRAKRIAQPNDLIMSSSAWQHCTPNQYDYVIKDSYNIKVLCDDRKREIEHILQMFDTHARI